MRSLSCAPLLAFALALVGAVDVRAEGPNDLTVHGLLDGNTPDQDAFLELSTEMGLVLTPSPLQPAETTGQSGFDFGIDLGVHGISFWEDFWSKGRAGGSVAPTLETIGIRGRKGFILPVPLTSEIELGASWLVESRHVLVGANWRVALNEGFRWIPDVSISLGINRLIGGDDLYLTTGVAGAQISKGISILGDVYITPFLNYQSIFIDARTRLIDPNPRNTNDVGNLINFEPAAAISVNNNDVGQCAADLLNCVSLNRYDRVSLGLRLQVALVQISSGVDVDILARRFGGPYLPVMIHGSTRLGLLF